MKPKKSIRMALSIILLFLSASMLKSRVSSSLSFFLAFYGLIAGLTYLVISKQNKILKNQSQQKSAALLDLSNDNLTIEDEKKIIHNTLAKQASERNFLSINISQCQSKIIETLNNGSLDGNKTKESYESYLERCCIYKEKFYSSVRNELFYQEVEYDEYAEEFTTHFDHYPQFNLNMSSDIKEILSHRMLLQAHHARTITLATHISKLNENEIKQKSQELDYLSKMI